MDKNEYSIMYTVENDYWWYRGLQALVGKYIQRFAKKSAARPAILDAGCGTGRMMELASGFGTVEGFDFSTDALDFCAKRGLRSAVQQDMNDWTSPPSTYDIIYSLDVLCHSSIKNSQEVLNRFYSALKPGGMLIMNLPAFELLRRNHDAAVYTKHRFTKAPFVRMLKAAGFSVQVATYRLPHFFFIMLLKKFLEKLSPSKKPRSDLNLLPGWINGILLLFNYIENAMIFRGIPMPVGGSLFAVGKKPV
jgi:SAM-dependent methyltransferase